MSVKKWIWIALGWVIILAMAACSPTGSPSPFEPEETPEPERTAGATEEPEPQSTSDPERSTPQPTRTVSGETPPAEQEVDRSVRLTPTLPGGIERVPALESTPVVGEVPDELMAAVLDDLVGKQKVERDAIEIIRAESVVWNDGSLGCPQPGMVYTQATVPGYWIVLKVKDVQYDYRANDRGYFLSCDQGPRLPGDSTGPGGTPTE